MFSMFTRLTDAELSGEKESISNKAALAQSIYVTKGTGRSLEVYLLGLSGKSGFSNSIFPHSRWYMRHEDALTTTTFLEKLKINDYSFTAFNLVQPKDLTSFKEIIQKREHVITLAYLDSKEDLNQYEQLAKVSILLLFVTGNEVIKQAVPQAIHWQTNDSLYSFYGKVMEKVEEISRPQLEENNHPSITRPSRLV